MRNYNDVCPKCGQKDTRDWRTYEERRLKTETVYKAKNDNCYIIKPTRYLFNEVFFYQKLSKMGIWEKMGYQTLSCNDYIEIKEEIKWEELSEEIDWKKYNEKQR